MKRRAFFGHLATIIAAAAAPTVFVPHTPMNWGKPVLYVPKTYKLKAAWSIELAQDLRAYHGIDADAEMTAYFKEYAQLQFPDKQILSVNKSEEIHYDPINFTPRHAMYVTVNEPVI